MNEHPKENMRYSPSAETGPFRLVRPEGKTWHREIIVSNRLPVTAKVDSEGKLVAAASSGGLVTALSPLLQEGKEGKWIGWPGLSDDDHTRFDDAGGLEEALRTHPNGGYDVGAVKLTPEDIIGYYEGYANDVLVPLLVSQPDKMNKERAVADWPVYQRVQQKFALKICEDVTSQDIVWIHDYQLMGVGAALRDMGVEQPVGFFLHTPFPMLSEFELLPQARSIIRDLLAHDLIGFQTAVFKDRFLDAVQKFVPEASLVRDGNKITTVEYAGRRTRVGNFPISIDPREFQD